MTEEVWKRIPNTLHYYVSNKGRVAREAYYSTYAFGKNKNIRQEWNEEKLILPYECGGKVNHRYLAVPLITSSGKLRPLFVHRLVAQAFIDGWSEEKNEVNHIDNDPQNNCAENLEWCDRYYNNQNRLWSGIRKPTEHSEEYMILHGAYHDYTENLEKLHNALMEENRRLYEEKPRGFRKMIHENAIKHKELVKSRLKFSEFVEKYF